jgi:CysZ protein
MAPPRASHIFLPFARAMGQLDDPAFIGVVVRSVAWSVACFAALAAGSIWAVHRLLALQGWLAWGGDFLGTIGASLLAFWLFLPVAAAIGTFYFERIASAVERRFYPRLPPAEHASALEQAWDGIAVALKVLALNVAALLLAVFIPGAGLILGWLIAAYAMGRGLFVAVAMRRMPRLMAESLYRQNRGAVLAQGAILAGAAYIPVANLLIPIIGTAAMVHILDLSLAGMPVCEPQRIGR